MNNIFSKLSIVTIGLCLSAGAVAMQNVETVPSNKLDALFRAMQTRATAFPELLTYENMKTLASGASITSGTLELKAVDADAITANMPSRFKQLSRLTLAAVGVANTAGARSFGAIKDNKNIIIQSYIYEPAAGMGTTFQFSVYYIDPDLSAGDITVFDYVTKRDRAENLKRTLGCAHSEVKQLLLDEKVLQIRETQLAPVEAEQAKYTLRRDRAIDASDKITTGYFNILIRKMEAEIAAIEMKLHFLTQTAPSLIRSDESMTAEDVFNMMDTTIVSNPYARKLQEKASNYRSAHREHIEANLKNY